MQQLEQLKPLRQRGLSNSHRQAKNFSAQISTEAKTFQDTKHDSAEMPLPSSSEFGAGGLQQQLHRTHNQHRRITAPEDSTRNRFQD